MGIQFPLIQCKRGELSLMPALELGEQFAALDTEEVYIGMPSGNVAVSGTGPAGPTGPTGPAGADGADGAPGSVWHSGSIAPTVGIGVDGDYYFRTSNGDVYGPKASGSWGSPVANLTGAQGIQGDPGVGPTGTVIAYASSSIPAGWLQCDGSAKSRTTYSALFGVIGTTWGSGDGSTTFNIPNLNGVFPRGCSASLADVGGTGGATSVTLTQSNLPNITLGGFWLKQGGGGASRADLAGGAVWDPNGTISLGGSSTAFSIIPTFARVNYLIKT